MRHEAIVGLSPRQRKWQTGASCEGARDQPTLLRRHKAHAQGFLVMRPHDSLARGAFALRTSPY